MPQIIHWFTVKLPKHFRHGGINPVIHQHPLDSPCLTAVPFHIHSSQQQIRSSGFHTIGLAAKQLTGLKPATLFDRSSQWGHQRWWRRHVHLQSSSINMQSSCKWRICHLLLRGERSGIDRGAFCICLSPFYSVWLELEEERIGVCLQSVISLFRHLTGTHPPTHCEEIHKLSTNILFQPGKKKKKNRWFPWRNREKP